MSHATFEMTPSHPRDSGPISLRPSLQGRDHIEIQAKSRALNILFEKLPSLTTHKQIHEISNLYLFDEEVKKTLYETMTKVAIVTGNHWDLFRNPDHGRHIFENPSIELWYKQVAILQCAYKLNWTLHGDPEFDQKVSAILTNLPQRNIAAREFIPCFGNVNDNLSDAERLWYFRLLSIYRKIPLQNSADEFRKLFEESLIQEEQERFFLCMRKTCIIEGYYGNVQFELFAFENLGIPSKVKERALARFAFEEGIATNTDPEFDSHFSFGLQKMQEEESIRLKAENSMLMRLKNIISPSSDTSPVRDVLLKVFSPTPA